VQHEFRRSMASRNPLSMDCRSIARTFMSGLKN
jgi:hypothetical protein